MLPTFALQAAAVLVAAGLVVACQGDGSAPAPSDAAIVSLSDAAARDDVSPDLNLVPPGGNDAGGVYVEPNDNCPDLYKQALLPTFALEMTPAELQALQAEYAGVKQREAAGLPVDPPHSARFSYGAETVASVSVRLNGPTYAWTGTKMPLAIDFDPAGQGVRFHGLRKIALDAHEVDRTFLRSRLALAFFRDLGIAAFCANNARLQINGEYKGLYANIEPLDGDLTRRLFPEAPGGDLWLYGWQPVDNPTPNWTRLKQFADGQDLATTTRMTDLAANVKEWAVEAVLPHGNGDWGLGLGHHLYDHPTRGFIFFPLALAASFDWVPANADPLYWTADWVAGPAARFLSTVADATSLAMYEAALEAVAARYSPDDMGARLDRWAAQIAASVMEDAGRGFSFAEHRQAVRQLRSYFLARASYVKAWLHCRKQGGGDLDGDGYAWCRDCDDASDGTHPGAAEICGDNRDNNCNGRRDEMCPGLKEDAGGMPEPDVGAGG